MSGILGVTWPGEPTGEAPGLAQVRQMAEALLHEGKSTDALELTLTALASVLRKSRDLELLVAKLRRERSGRKTEKVPAAQLQLLLEAAAEQTGELEPAAESQQDEELTKELEAAQAEADAIGRSRKKKRKRRGDGVRTGKVDRERRTSRVPDADRCCARCGQERKVIGQDRTSRLEYVPGHFKLLETESEVLACECKDEVVTAPAPPALVPKSMVTPSLMAHLLSSKLFDGLPLTRLRRIYARSGVDIPLSTLADWFAFGTGLLEALRNRLFERCLVDFMLATDATGLKVLDRKHSENITKGAMWCTIGDDRHVVFHYTPTGEGVTGPWEFLKGRKGYIQADAAPTFDRLFNGKVARATEVGCWAHGRRKFEALVEVDCRVAFPLKLIGRLFAFEELADLKRLDPEGRKALRQERSAPELQRLHGFLVTSYAREPPASQFAKACAYVINHWEALLRFLDDGRIRLTNNICEQQMKSVALGRKNFLFAGSHDAAHRLAAGFSVVRTAAQYGVEPLEYLTYVFTRIANGHSLDSPESVDLLLPHAWREAHPERCHPTAAFPD